VYFFCIFIANKKKSEKPAAAKKRTIISVFHPAAVTDSTAWASMLNRHGKNRKKRKAAARLAAQ
jgi:hypothetical protein